jgi:hypothetical protein
MAIELKRVAPPDSREATVQLFWKMRAWPFETIEDYFRHWDWRYSCTSEEPAAVWIAVDGDQTVGHLAVNFRHFQVEGQDVRVGVPANFLVDDGYRNAMIGPLLVRAAQKMVRRRELDLFLAYNNAAAHALSMALGFKDIGRMDCLLEVRRWAPVLGRRIPGGAILGPFANAVAKLRKRVKKGATRDPCEALVVQHLTPEELAAIDRSHWPHREGLTWSGSGTYLVNRFLRCPFREYRAFGIVHKLSQRLEGFLVTEGSARLKIILCGTNEDVLSEAEAVDLVADARSEVEVVVVPLLPQSSLAANFEKAAFLARSGKNADEVMQRSFWSACWLPEHSLASAFARTEGWKLWYGWSQH